MTFPPRRRTDGERSRSSPTRFEEGSGRRRPAFWDPSRAPSLNALVVPTRRDEIRDYVRVRRRATRRDDASRRKRSGNVRDGGRTFFPGERWRRRLSRGGARDARRKKRVERRHIACRSCRAFSEPRPRDADTPWAGWETRRRARAEPEWSFAAAGKRRPRKTRRERSTALFFFGGGLFFASRQRSRLRRPSKKRRARRLGEGRGARARGQERAPTRASAASGEPRERGKRREPRELGRDDDVRRLRVIVP